MVLRMDKVSDRGPSIWCVLLCGAIESADVRDAKAHEHPKIIEYPIVQIIRMTNPEAFAILRSIACAESTPIRLLAKLALLNKQFNDMVRPRLRRYKDILNLRAKTLIIKMRLCAKGFKYHGEVSLFAKKMSEYHYLLNPDQAFKHKRCKLFAWKSITLLTDKPIVDGSYLICAADAYYFGGFADHTKTCRCRHSIHRYVLLRRITDYRSSSEEIGEFSMTLMRCPPIKKLIITYYMILFYSF